MVVAFLGVAAAGVPSAPFRRALAGGSVFALLALLPLSVAVDLREGIRPSFDPDGFRLGVAATARATGVLSATLLLSSTLPFPRLVGFLRRLGCPSAAVDLASLVHREIFLLEEGFAGLREALGSRGGWRNGRTIRRSLALAAASLLAGSAQRSGRLAEGLASRGSPDGNVLYPAPELAWSWRGIGIAVAIPAATGLLSNWIGGRFGI
jgi:energy-coupling factor transporter transmembrane protein EcfT